MDILTYALLKKKIEQGGSGALPANNVLYNQIDIQGDVIGWSGSPMPSGNNFEVKSAYLNINQDPQDVYNVLNTFFDSHPECSITISAEESIGYLLIYGTQQASLILNRALGKDIGLEGEDANKTFIYLINDSDREYAGSGFYFIWPNSKQACELFGVTSLGWNSKIKALNGCLTINGIDTERTPEEVQFTAQLAEELKNIISSTPFTPVNEIIKSNVLINTAGDELLPSVVSAKRDENMSKEPLESAQLQDARGNKVFPKTKISQILNDDGTKWTPSSDAALIVVDLGAETSEGSDQFKISAELYNKIIDNPAAPLKFIENGNAARAAICTGFYEFNSPGFLEARYYSSTFNFMGPINIIYAISKKEAEYLVTRFQIEVPTGLTYDNSGAQELGFYDGFDEGIPTGDKKVKVATINNNKLIFNSGDSPTQDQLNIDTTILISPNGTKYRIIVSDEGLLSTEKIN